MTNLIHKYIKKLLIVDDSKIARMFIREHISAKHPDWIFIEATSGEEALEILNQEQPDYCTMDINMPGMLGIEAAKIILNNYPKIKLAFFSSCPSYQEEVESLGSILVLKPVVETSIRQILDFFGE